MDNCSDYVKLQQSQLEYFNDSCIQFIHYFIKEFTIIIDNYILLAFTVIWHISYNH